MRSGIVAGLLIIPAGCLQAAPSIAANGIVNSADQASAAGAGIPKGGLFTIYGAELAPREAQAPAVPLPTTLSNVRVRISAPSPLGVRDYYAPLHYVSPGQINAVLPSIMPEGSAELRVVVNSVVSEPVNIQVVGSRFSAFTRGGLGFGPGIAQQYGAAGTPKLNLFQAPARPGNVVVLWGTGLGPVGPGEDAAPAAGNLRDDVTIHVRGAAIKPVYAGRAPGLPGVDQINFQLPETVSSGCFAPLQVEVGGISTPLLTLSVAAEADVCTTDFALSRSALARLDEGKTLRIAVVNYESDAAAPVRQTAQGWVGEYDAAHFSLLATAGKSAGQSDTAWCEQRAYTRTRSQTPEQRDRLYGLRVLGDLQLGLRITGRECAWTPVSGTMVVEAPSTSTCAATGIALTVTAPRQETVSATGGLPDLRENAIRNFSTSMTGRSLRATWQAAPDTQDDRATVTIGSTFTLSGNIFSGATTVREVSCHMPASIQEFVFSPEQTSWARGLQTQTPASLEVVRTTREALQPAAGELGQDTVDLVLLRRHERASATAR